MRPTAGARTTPGSSAWAQTSSFAGGRLAWTARESGDQLAVGGLHTCGTTTETEASDGDGAAAAKSVMAVHSRAGRQTCGWRAVVRAHSGGWSPQLRDRHRRPDLLLGLQRPGSDW